LNYPPIVLLKERSDEFITLSAELVKAFMATMVQEKRKIFWIRKAVYPIKPQRVWCFGPNTSNMVKVSESLIDRILVVVSNLFNQHKLYVQEDLDQHYDTNIEVHYAKTDNKELVSDFAIDEDNDGCIHGKLHTCIVYFDVNCVGGLLNVYDEDENFLYAIDPHGTGEKTKVVLFDGGMKHCPSPVLDGRRIIVTYQFRQSGQKGGALSNPANIDLCEGVKPFESNVLVYGKEDGKGLA
jgi:hypothetical protein